MRWEFKLTSFPGSYLDSQICLNIPILCGCCECVPYVNIAGAQCLHQVHHIEKHLFTVYVVNAEMHECLVYQEWLSIECLAINRTFIPHLLRVRKQCEREELKNIKVQRQKTVKHFWTWYHKCRSDLTASAAAYNGTAKARPVISQSQASHGGTCL